MRIILTISAISLAIAACGGGEGNSNAISPPIGNTGAASPTPQPSKTTVPSPIPSVMPSASPSPTPSITPPAGAGISKNGFSIATKQFLASSCPKQTPAIRGARGWWQCLEGKTFVGFEDINKKRYCEMAFKNGRFIYFNATERLESVNWDILDSRNEIDPNGGEYENNPSGSISYFIGSVFVSLFSSTPQQYAAIVAGGSGDPQPEYFAEISLPPAVEDGADIVRKCRLTPLE